MRTFVTAAVLGIAALGFVTVSPSQAHGQLAIGPGFGLQTPSAIGPGFGLVTPNYTPAYSYYGNGGHDTVPHWHRTTTPFGSFSWYGNGLHDYLPHNHVRTPYSYQGFSRTPFGYTQSFYSPYPYYYSPW